MNITRFTASVLAILQEWKEELKPEEVATTPLPIIIVPPRWMTAARSVLNLTEDIQSVWDCEVLIKEDTAHPIIVRHDGKVMVLDKTWEGDAHRIIAAEEKRARKARRRIVGADGQPLLH